MYCLKSSFKVMPIEKLKIVFGKLLYDLIVGILKYFQMLLHQKCPIFRLMK